jgi:hypothetical protein
MSTQKLEIIIGADAKGLVKGVQETTKSLSTIPVVAAKAGAALQVMSKSSNTATAALTNLGRVAQDAPFGFIGISNNLNPLLESFQRLKAESGSTGGALKALAGSLGGAGGIGLALSAITAAVTFAQMGFRAWGGAAKESAEKVKDAVAESAKGVGSELVKLQSYVSFAQDVTKSYDERKKAVDALQKEYPQYLKNITDEALLTGQATDAINKSIDAILRKATINLLKDEIAAAVAESAKAILAVEKGIIAAKQARAAQERLKKGLDGTNDEYEKQAQKALETGRAMGDVNREFTAMNNQAQRFVENTPEKRIARIKEELQVLVQPLIDATVNFEDLGTAAGGKAAKGVRDLTDAFDGFRKLTKTSLADTDVEDFFGTSFGRVRAIFKIDAELDAAAAKKVEADLKSMVEQIRQQEAIQKGLVIPVKIKSNVSAQLSADLVAAIDAATAAARLKIIDFTSTLKNISVDAATSIGEGIGNALTGVDNPFAPLISVIAQGLKAVGKLYIQTGIQMLAAQKALKAIANNPYLTIIAGIALTALGQVAQSLLSKQTKFAEGGIVSGPTNALIGEAGQSEVVMPLSRLGSLLRGGGATVLTSRISGMDILLSGQRAAASQNRTFG